MPNQEPAFEWPFGNGPVRVGTQGAFPPTFPPVLEQFRRAFSPGPTDRPWVSEDALIVDCSQYYSWYRASRRANCHAISRLTNLVKYYPMLRKTLKVILKNNAKLDKMPIKPARTDKETFNWRYVNWLYFFTFLLPGYFSSAIGFLNVALVRVSDSIGNF